MKAKILIKINIKTYETQEGTLKDVAYGRVDAYVNSRTVLMAQIKKTGLPLKLAGDPIVYEQVAFPFAKDDAHDKLRKKSIMRLMNCVKTEH